jgi:PAS domain S-box-containing protein
MYGDISVGSSLTQGHLTLPMRNDDTFTVLFLKHPLPMWIYDRETLAFLEVNEAAIARYGYTRDEFLRMAISDIRPEEDVPRLLAEARRADAPGLNFSGDWRHRLRDGRVIDVEITSGTLEFRGRLATLVAVHDVTERKRAEETRARLASIVTSSDDAILSTTPDGVVLTWNAGAEKLYGYTASEMVGRNSTVFVPEHKRMELAAILERVARGERVKSFETERLRKDGSLVDVSLTVSPIEDFHGRVIGISATARDITERNRREADVRRLEEELAVQRLRVFRATMTTVHDIVNNLLNGLQLICLEAGDGRLSEDTCALFDRLIEGAAEKLKRLSDQQHVREKEMAIGLAIDYPGADM